MTRVIRSRVLPAFLSIALAIMVGLATAYLVNRLRGAESPLVSAQGVQVTSPDGVVIGNGTTAEQALQIASEKAGYQVRGLEFTPGGGFELRSIMVSLGAYDSAPRWVTLDYVRRDEVADHGVLRIMVSESNRPITRPANWRPEDDPNQLFDIGVPGVDVWASGDPMRKGYSFNADGRGYVLIIDQRQPPEQEVRRMIRELID